jgi:hypothetical protein
LIVANEETGLNLFDETASAAGNFPYALRGYDRSAVDDYVRSLESTVVAARRQIYGLDEQLAGLQEQLDEAHAKAAAEELNYANLGGRATDILRLAEEQAREVIDRANVDAEKIKESARREADNTRLSAERKAREIKTSGLAEIQQLRARGQQDAKNQLEKAAAEAATVLAAARREAESLRREADQHAQTLRETTYLDTETLRRHAETEAAAVRQQVAVEREQAIAQLRRVHEDAVAATAAMLSEATQQATQSRERLEAEVAEAARIRADALAEAEQARLAAMQETEERIALATKQAAAINERTQQEFAWRKQQLRRDTDLLSQRKQAVLNQLASLSALAEQTAQNFPELEDLDDFPTGPGHRSEGLDPSENSKVPDNTEGPDSSAGPADANATEEPDRNHEDTVVHSARGTGRGPAASREDYDPDATVRVPVTDLPPAGNIHLGGPSAEPGGDDEYDHPTVTRPSSDRS